MAVRILWCGNVQDVTGVVTFSCVFCHAVRQDEMVVWLCAIGVHTRFGVGPLLACLWCAHTIDGDALRHVGFVTLPVVASAFRNHAAPGRILALAWPRGAGDVGRSVA